MSPEIRSRKGFTLVELLIVVAIFALAASSLLPFSGKYVPRQTLAAYRLDVIDTLRRAQHQAVSYERNSAWGVKFHATGSYVLFAGNSYAARTTTYDKTRTLLSSYTFAGLSEVVFARGTGETATGGTIYIIHADSGLEAQIDINARGVISPPPISGYQAVFHISSSAASVAQASSSASAGALSSGASASSASAGTCSSGASVSSGGFEMGCQSIEGP